MRTLSILAISLALMAASACSSSGVKEEYSADGKVTSREFRGGDPDYSAYLSTVSAQKAPSVDVSACAGDATCVVAVAGFAAMGNGNRQDIRPPAPKRTMGDRFESIAKATIGVLPGLGGIYSGMEAAKEGRREREALYGTFASFGTNLATLGATPTYSAGGDIITGTRTETNIADSYNDSSDRSSRRDTLVDSGNTTTTVDGDGNATGEGNTVNNGDWRHQSDGPFDDHSNDGDCDGTVGGCQTPPPEPIDPGT